MKISSRVFKAVDYKNLFRKSVKKLGGSAVKENMKHFASVAAHEGKRMAAQAVGAAKRFLCKMAVNLGVEIVIAKSMRWWKEHSVKKLLIDLKENCNKAGVKVPASWEEYCDRNHEFEPIQNEYAQARFLRAVNTMLGNALKLKQGNI